MINWIEFKDDEGDIIVFNSEIFKTELRTIAKYEKDTVLLGFRDNNEDHYVKGTVSKIKEQIDKHFHDQQFNNKFKEVIK